MRVTVLIPTYNRAKYVCHAIDSILRQTYSGISIYVYDDGSSDQTDKAISKYGDKITYFRDTTNRGVSYARNFLISQTKTEIAAFQDSDDLSNIHRIALQVEYIKKGYHLCATGKKWFNDGESVNISEDPMDVNQKDRTAPASMMFKMDGVLEFDLQKSGGGEDVEWRRRMTHKFGEYKAIKKVLYYIREHKHRIGYWKRGRYVDKDWVARMKAYRDFSRGSAQHGR